MLTLKLKDLVKRQLKKAEKILERKNNNEEYDSGFRFSKRSLGRLEGVDGELKNLVFTALRISDVDFGVTEGLRTIERQKELKSKGLSQTLKSKHLTGHAVDVWPTGCKDQHLADDHILVAEAFREASIMHTVDIVWGAAWGRTLADHGSALEAYEAYVQERRSQGRTPFIDGVHFEMKV